MEYTPILNWRYVELVMLVCMSLLMSLSTFTVSSALFISSDTVVVHGGGCFWLKLVAMELFILCNAVSVEWFLLEMYCVVFVWNVVCNIWKLCLM